MDEFVALTERYGLKPRGKSAPMAASKRSEFNLNSVKASPFDPGDDANAELTLNDSKFDFLNPGGGFDDFLVFDELTRLSSTNDSGDDLLGGLTGLSPNEDGFDELIPGFGGSGPLSNNEFQETEAVQVKKQQFGVLYDLDSLFIPGPRSSSVPTYSWGSPVASAQFLDEFSPLFGESEELPGESDKRRVARWEREQLIKNRMEKVIDDMNKRDLQIQIEQEERSRISETLDAEIKLWATGKEGNLRALISSLHLVLWPGCGWEAVSLTDLITSSAVKKVYKKANLYVHPDKVQQKGAQQKYIAEKVFTILQEAWNKFNKEELS
ncbi:auxilin-related protein 2-like [Raphanus sativus]|uniref:Auxilin-related protein 2-like n=1 Tax=Raphanus sativus TaxID=3726 RepID=A0A6J0L0M0_RAPSA|nr:auxilin-related protein 2-like [Raphanus sativus]